MTNTSLMLVIWGIITIASLGGAFLGYRLLSNPIKFENRKREIAAGMVVCAWAVSAFLFLPVLFSGIDLHQIGVDLFDQIQFAEMNAEEVGEKLSLPPFVKFFAKGVALFSADNLGALILIVSSITVLMIGLLVVLIILKIPEQENTNSTPEGRKHLFEYKEDVLKKVNENFER